MGTLTLKKDAYENDVNSLGDSNLVCLLSDGMSLFMFSHLH